VHKNKPYVHGFKTGDQTSSLPSRISSYSQVSRPANRKRDTPGWDQPSFCGPTRSSSYAGPGSCQPTGLIKSFLYAGTKVQISTSPEYMPNGAARLFPNNLIHVRANATGNLHLFHPFDAMLLYLYDRVKIL
jgi:hypothetical protein